MTLSRLVQASATDQYVELYQLDAREYGLSDILYFVSARNILAGMGQRIVYQGIEYSPLPITITGVRWAGQGPTPRPKMQVSNIGGYVGSLLDGHDLLGARVTRIVTFARYLDGWPHADPTAHFPPEIWRIERKIRQDPTSIEWELASVTEVEGRRIPGRIMTRDICMRSYRVWRGNAFVYGDCPYAGTNYYSAQGEPVGEPARDVCGKTLHDCQLRFGSADLPIWAFPGLARARA